MLKKIADIIVEKRKLVLIIMLALTVVCVGLMTQVEINEDMTKYLDDESSMKIGMDIMNEEFPAMEQPSVIRVMFTDLADEEKSQILETLQKTDHVTSVTYDPDSPDYNKDNHTLYVLNIDCPYGGEEEASIEASLENNFSGYEVVWRNGDVSLPDLPLWIALVAVAMLIIILLIMCGSWIEPLLFLSAIGIAVAINMGTNIILGSISSITFSISAILQLALSMDYSIILINRYRQEKAQVSNSVEAMKSALVHAFSSIASSSLTTVVGLLALLFMSFKIGFDLGIVLAKGVALSMICILTALPGIILMFDKLIEKTAKKELNVPMGKLASFSYRMRTGIAIFFVFLFAGSYILQGSTAIAYTLTDEDPVATVFPKENMLVMVYETKDEAAVSQIAYDLENDENIRSVMGYSTMLAKPMTAEDMASSINAMAGDMPLDESVLKMLYYTYHTDGRVSDLTAGEMLGFLSENSDNELFASYMGNGETGNSLSMLSAFKDAESLTKPMTADELAKIFGMKSDDIKNLYLYYFTQKGGVSVDKMTLSVFADFVINEVAKDKTYGAMFDEKTLSGLTQLQLFADAAKMTKPCTYKEIASMLGIEEEMAKMLFAYYFASQPDYNPEPMTAEQFTSLAIELSENPAFSSYFDSGTTSLIKMLSVIQPLLKGPVGSKQLTCDELADLLKTDEDMLRILYAVNEADSKSSQWKVSMYKLMNFLGENKELVSSMADPSSAEMMTTAQNLVNASVNATAFTPDGLSELTGMEPSQAQQLYVLYTSLHGDTSGWKLSIQNFVKFINSHILTNDDFLLNLMKTHQSFFLQPKLWSAQLFQGKDILRKIWLLCLKE